MHTSHIYPYIIQVCYLGMKQILLNEFQLHKVEVWVMGNTGGNMAGSPETYSSVTPSLVSNAIFEQEQHW